MQKNATSPEDVSGLDDDLDESAHYHAEQSPTESAARASVKKVYGSAKNFERFGLPSEVAQDERLCYYFYPTWRSQLMNLIWFFSSCIAVVVISFYFEKYVVLPGKLFTIGNTVYKLHLPYLTLIPGFVLGKILFTMYNSRYIIDEGGVEAQVGLVSFYLRQPRLRYEDIRGVEPEQSIVERILGIGRVLIGSAMTADVEIVMEGVGDPRAIQLLINKERDNRLSRVRGTAASQLLTGD